MKVGDLVKVKTKFHGDKLGTIVEGWDEEARNRAWIVHIPNHWTSGTITPETDMEVINETR